MIACEGFGSRIDMDWRLIAYQRVSGNYFSNAGTLETQSDDNQDIVNFKIVIANAKMDQIGLPKTMLAWQKHMPSKTPVRIPRNETSARLQSGGLYNFMQELKCPEW